MKLSISNIAWPEEKDLEMYALLRQMNYSGLEIAPTRLFPSAPYSPADDVRAWAARLKENYGLSVPSMQSIWFGRTERLFYSRQEYETLLSYTMRAVDFAAAAGCGSLVFGCPRNRYFPAGADPAAGVKFFHEIGEYARSRGTVIALEANPVIYGTNYITDTRQALDLIAQVQSDGLRLNLDVGTMLYNNEDISELRGCVPLISHVHISEPGLEPVRERPLHRQLYELLAAENYSSFISIEMKRCDSIPLIREKMAYLARVFRSD